MSDLISRLENADGPDRELDDDIAHHLGVVPVGYALTVTASAVPEIDYTYAPPAGTAGSIWTTPRLTASIDACLEVAERVGLNAGWIMGEAQHRWLDLNRPTKEFRKELPTAILIAIMKARENTNE